MKNWRRGLLSICLVLFVAVSSAQNPREELRQYQERYGDEWGVLLQLKEAAEIFVGEDGELTIKSDVYQERMFMADNANLFGEGSVSFSSFREIENLYAASKVPNKNRYKTIEVKDFQEVDEYSSSIFIDDVKLKKFIYPGLTKGAKTVLSYREIYREPRFFGSFFFRSYFPVEYSEFSLSFPNEVKVQFKLFGEGTEAIQFEKKEGKNKTTLKWSLKEGEKLSFGDSRLSSRYYAPHIIVYVNEYQFNGELKSVIRDVDDLHAYYSDFLKDVNQEEDLRLKQLSDSLVAKQDNELDKVKAIYYWVQDNIRYIAIENGLGGFIPRDANTIYERRYGDCKDMSSIINQMLKYAGIPSYLTWVGTRNIPYKYTEVPTPMVDNHMICTYKQGKQYYFLDATNEISPFDRPPSAIQGKQALVHINDHAYELVEVPIMDRSLNRWSDTVEISLEDGNLKGKGRATFSGYNKEVFTYRIMNKTESDRRDYMKRFLLKGNNKFFLESLTESNLYDREKDLILDYSFLLKDYALAIGEEVFINPHLTKTYENEIIDLEQTKVPQSREFKETEVNVVKLKIPDGFDVSYLPENKEFEDDDFKFSLKYEKKADQLIVSEEVVIDHLILEPKKFETWNQFVKALGKAYKETIILKKR